jgi:hypothetical protein
MQFGAASTVGLAQLDCPSERGLVFAKVAGQGVFQRNRHNFAAIGICDQHGIRRTIFSKLNSIGHNLAGRCKSFLARGGQVGQFETFIVLCDFVAASSMKVKSGHEASPL